MLSEADIGGYILEKKKIWKDERVQAGVLVLAAFLLLTAWAFMQPLGAGPDEKMRYMVAQYLHAHSGKLPLGDEPTIRDATWGISDTEINAENQNDLFPK